MDCYIIMIEFAIPSSNRYELLEPTTLKLLNENNITNITIFVPESQVTGYENHFPDIKIQGVPVNGIRKC